MRTSSAINVMPASIVSASRPILHRAPAREPRPLPRDRWFPLPRFLGDNGAPLAAYRPLGGDLEKGASRATRASGGDREHAHRRALDACSRVAREEFAIAKAALVNAEQIGFGLKSSVAAISRRAPHDGAAVEDARARLEELEAKFDATVTKSLSATRSALEAKHAALNRFTVTLFGRTMAGKSTIREALTRGDGSTIGVGAHRTTRNAREYPWNSLRIIDTP